MNIGTRVLKSTIGTGGEATTIGTEIMVDLIKKLEYSLREYLDFNVTITISKDQIIIHGASSDLDEAVIGIFIKGFLSGWNHKNKPLIKVFKPEVG